MSPDVRELLCHFLAALAYRTQKALRDAPATFSSYRASPGVRTPHELVRHMTSVLGYARTHFIGGSFRPPGGKNFSEEVLGFHEMLQDLRACLVEESPLRGTTPERLLQGPLTDAMTHAGQLALLRRMAGSPIPPESFIDAAIDATNVGPTQPEPVSPDEEWLLPEDERVDGR